MVKIAMITGSFPFDKCGVGDYTKILSDNLSDNIDLSIVTSCKNINNKGSLKVYNDIDDWSFKSISKVLKVLKEINPDIVHIQYPTKAYGRKVMINILPLLLKVKGYKVVTTIHEYSDNSFLGKVRCNLSIAFSDFVVVVDNRYKLDIKNIFKNKKVEYINIASNIPKSNSSLEEKAKIREKVLGENNDKKIMSYFGFIHDKKGIESILYAMKKLKDENKLNSIFLIIAELNKTDSYHEKLLNLMSELGLREDIVITGYLKDYEVADNLNISDFVVLPFVDGFSPKNGSVLAALQENKMVITTESKILTEKPEGLIIIDNYQAIDQLALAIDKQQNELKAVNNSTDNNFNWNYVSKRHMEIYNKLNK